MGRTSTRTIRENKRLASGVNKGPLALGLFVVVSAIVGMIMYARRLKCNTTVTDSASFEECVQKQCGNEHKASESAILAVKETISKNGDNPLHDDVRRVYEQQCPTFYELAKCECRMCMRCDDADDGNARKRCTLVEDVDSASYCRDDYLNRHDLASISAG